MRIRAAMLRAIGAEPPYALSRPMRRSASRKSRAAASPSPPACRLSVDRLLTRRLRLDEINEGFDRLREGVGARQAAMFD